ncbi:hypothetical protein SKAU_G00342650 [Synaphobranchus kaupii]|uniref:CRIB domain-containing protein n=1 Tax=Synaphobranchus kaupii TaxID=118154 RepID=A0A9Q1IH61_SYNKA|nr:hypothetical protein SKAU_G00342650 [Synaphobranchus kaupii]
MSQVVKMAFGGGEWGGVCIWRLGTATETQEQEVALGGNKGSESQKGLRGITGASGRQGGGGAGKEGRKQFLDGAGRTRASTIEGNRAAGPSPAVSYTGCRAARESRERNRPTPGMSQFWHKIGCCVAAKPPPKRKRRRKIDRTMIGEPMNFMHLTHIGSGEMTEALAPSSFIPPSPVLCTSGLVQQGFPCRREEWGHLWVRPGTDEVKRTKRQRPEKPVIAGPKTKPGRFYPSGLPPDPTRPDPTPPHPTAE